MCIEITWEIVLNANSDSVGLVWEIKFCSSNELPGDADAVGPGTTL